MAENSKIEWTDATWNPVLGCDKISPGCKGCYAIRTAWRLQHNPNPKVAKAFEGLTVMQGGQPNWTGRVNFIPERLDEPVSWQKPKRIFVNSQSDLFHEGIDFSQIAAIFGVMAATPWHTYQVLTKRPARALEFYRWIATGDVSHPEVRGCTLAMARILGARAAMIVGPGARGEIAWPLPNVWLGVSVETPEYKSRIDILRETPAAVRMLSLEPLLEDLGEIDLRGIHWVIVGGESGPNARPMHPDWARSLRDQCKAAGVPFFFKQWGEWAWGSDCHKEQLCVYADGRSCEFTQEAILAEERRSGIEHRLSGGTVMAKLGKKAAGRKLSGVEHNEYPVSATGERRA